PPRGGSIGLTERLENRRVLAPRNADAGVRDHKVQDGTRVAVHLLAHLQEHVAEFGKLQRVTEQVREDLTEAPRIAHEYQRNVRRDVADELEVLLMGAQRERFQHVADHFAKRERDRLELQLPGLDFREIKDVVENGEQRER